MPGPFLFDTITALSMAVACATLSVLVVSRRWAFIGEGISHSGFGGAGTAWAAAALWPAVDHWPWAPYAGVVLFSLAAAAGIAYFTRRERLNSDTAIGIFLVASLAWGILAQQLYVRSRHNDPVGWDVFLFGRMADLSPAYALGSAMLCAAVVFTVILLAKEIVAYCFDPTTAEASGVRVGFIHYLLLVLIALTIVIGVRIAGSVLVPALLVLPGASALQVTDRLRRTVVVSVAFAAIATVAGLLLNRSWPFLPTGPLIVLALFVQFLAAYGWGLAANR